MDLNRERGKRFGKEKGEDVRGGKALGGKGRISAGKGGGKILGRKGRRSGDKGLRGERGEMISTEKGVEKILGRKGRRSGRKKANRERGERSKEGKGKALRGGKGLRGARVGRISTGKGGKQS